jgi:hypothetical protein
MVTVMPVPVPEDAELVDGLGSGDDARESSTAPALVLATGADV